MCTSETTRHHTSLEQLGVKLEAQTTNRNNRRWGQLMDAGEWGSRGVALGNGGTAGQVDIAHENHAPRNRVPRGTEKTKGREEESKRREGVGDEG